MNLYSLDVCRPNVSCVVKEPAMSVILEEHVFKNEDDAWYLMLYYMVLGA